MKAQPPGKMRGSQTFFLGPASPWILFGADAKRFSTRLKRRNLAPGKANRFAKSGHLSVFPGDVRFPAPRMFACSGRFNRLIEAGRIFACLSLNQSFSALFRGLRNFFPSHP